MLVAVNFHYVRPSFDAPHPSIHGLTPSQFEAQLDVLSQAGTFVSASEVRERMRGGKLPERSILITFDDGLREQFDHALPVLNKLGIPALYFINTAPNVEERVLTVHQIHLLRSVVSPSDFLAMLQRAAAKKGIELGGDVPGDLARAQYPYDTEEAARLKYLLNACLTEAQRSVLADLCFAEVFPRREAKMARELYMDPGQIRALEGSIGSHTHAHLALGLIGEDAARSEIESSMTHLEVWLGRRPFAVSYPYGSREICTKRVGELTAASGADFAFTMERAANRTFASPYHLTRIDCNDAPGGKSCKFGPEELFDALPEPSWFPN